MKSARWIICVLKYFQICIWRLEKVYSWYRWSWICFNLIEPPTDKGAEVVVIAARGVQSCNVQSRSRVHNHVVRSRAAALRILSEHLQAGKQKQGKSQSQSQAKSDRQKKTERREQQSNMKAKTKEKNEKITETVKLLSLGHRYCVGCLSVCGCFCWGCRRFCLDFFASGSALRVPPAETRLTVYRRL